MWVMDPVPIAGDACSLVSQIPHTFISTVWTVISYAFSRYWYLIVPGLVVWVAIEILTRNNHHYNSDNGLTPIFNSFIGGGVFFVFESIIYFILNFVFGKGINCGLLWLNSLYLIPFVVTSFFLNWIGFWVYMKDPFERKRKAFRRGSKRKSFSRGR